MQLSVLNSWNFLSSVCLKLKRSKYTLKFNGTSENGFDCLLKSVQMMIFLQQQHENRWYKHFNIQELNIRIQTFSVFTLTASFPFIVLSNTIPIIRTTITKICLILDHIRSYFKRKKKQKLCEMVIRKCVYVCTDTKELFQRHKDIYM